MAKIKHNNPFDVSFSIVSQAIERKVVKLHEKGKQFNSRTFNIDHQELKNFGYFGYLGLEKHPLVLQGAIDAIRSHGTLYGISRAYITNSLEEELKGLLALIYQNKRMVIQNGLANTHVGTMPNLISGEDLIVLDQQVHFTVQTGAQLCRQNGTEIKMIRHNSVEMLDRILTSSRFKYRRIWYAIDGVYSMFGDYPPFDTLLEMMAQYDNLMLYVDDAHGTSWCGPRGAGYAFSLIGNHPQVVLNTTLGKGFGSAGGVTFFPNDDMYKRVYFFGGSLTYSAPPAPSITGASIASAKIHLTSTINQLQWDLAYRIGYCSQLLQKAEIHVESEPTSPIFFIRIGNSQDTYYAIEELKKRGIYANAGLFPAVSVKNSGIRFTITNHNTIDDIEQMVDALSDIKNCFVQYRGEGAIPYSTSLATNKSVMVESLSEDFTVNLHQSIEFVNHQIWNLHLGLEGNFNASACADMEQIFTGNANDFENWKLYYLEIYHKSGKPALLALLSQSITKDDFLEKPEISIQIEEERRLNPYYLTSKMLMLGSTFTEGQHLYINPEFDTNDRMKVKLIQIMQEIVAEEQLDGMLLRDFTTSVPYFKTYGLTEIAMPYSNELMIDSKIETIDQYYKALDKKKRTHWRNDIFKNLPLFDAQFKDWLSPDEIEEAYTLYQQVSKKNYSLNYFTYPKKFVEVINQNPDWEFLVLTQKESKKMVAFGAIYKAKEAYVPMFIGLDYDFVYEQKTYKIMLYKCLERALGLKSRKVRFGFTADLEKRKMGANQVPTYAYVMLEENFSLEVIKSMSVASAKSSL